MIAKTSASENQSAARALAILDVLASSPTALGVREIARQLNVAPSIAQRLVRTLCAANFLEQIEETSRYTIGYRAFVIGNAFIEQSSIHSAVIPELNSLAEQQVNGFLGVLRDRAVVYLANVQSNGPIALTQRTGSQTYVHSTALGKALLAEMTDQQIRSLLANQQLPRLTKNTIISIPQLMTELQQVRQRGYSLSDEENRIGVFSVGAVVRDAANRPVAALSGGVPISMVNKKDRARIVELVLAASRNASRRLGARIDGDDLLRRSPKASRSRTS